MTVKPMQAYYSLSVIWTACEEIYEQQHTIHNYCEWDGKEKTLEVGNHGMSTNKIYAVVPGAKTEASGPTEDRARGEKLKQKTKLSFGSALRPRVDFLWSNYTFPNQALVATYLFD